MDKFFLKSSHFFCCCSVAMWHLTLWDPTDCSMSGFPVLHQLPEFAQTHVHWVGDAIQPSHARRPLHLPSILPSSRVFSNELALCNQWPNYWSFSFTISPSNEYSELISCRTDWFDLPAVQWTLKTPPTPQFESIKSSVFSHFYGTTLTTVHDYWKKIIALIIQTFVGKLISLLSKMLSMFS